MSACSVLFCLFLLISQGTLFPLLHPVGLFNFIKNVPTQSSVTEVGVLVSLIFTLAESIYNILVYMYNILILPSSNLSFQSSPARLNFTNRGERVQSYWQNINKYIYICIVS